MKSIFSLCVCVGLGFGSRKERWCGDETVDRGRGRIWIQVEWPEEQATIPLYLPPNTNVVVDCRICGDLHSVGSFIQRVLELHLTC